MNGGDAYESRYQIYERKSLLSVSDSLQLMLAFGSFVLLLVGTIVSILKNDKKNNH